MIAHWSFAPPSSRKTNPPELRFHLQAALNHGVTLDELRELMITAIVYVGFPTGVEGFRSLAEVESRQ